MRALRGSLLAHGQRLPISLRSCGPNRRFPPFFPRAHLSSVPERTRKLPSAGKAWQWRTWQRNFLRGLLIGAVLTPAWILYDKYAKGSSFVQYRLVRKEPVSSTASIFHLEPESGSRCRKCEEFGWPEMISNFQFKQPQIQIVRAYTPLPPTQNGEGGGALRFLIRREHEGEVSNYIHSLPLGAKVELRGPNIEYHLPHDIKEVVFVAGGTGIAPALQVAHAMFDPPFPGHVRFEQDRRKILILWANRRREDCVGGGTRTSVVESANAPAGGLLNSVFRWVRSDPTPSQSPVTQEEQKRGLIVKELEDLAAAHPGQISVQYFVNEEDTWINARALDQALNIFDDDHVSREARNTQERRQIIISGPPGFITHIAGSKEWRNGREEQGAVSHLLAHALSQNPHNVKIWKV